MCVDICCMCCIVTHTHTHSYFSPFSILDTCLYTMGRDTCKQCKTCKDHLINVTHLSYVYFMKKTATLICVIMPTQMNIHSPLSPSLTLLLCCISKPALVEERRKKVLTIVFSCLVTKELCHTSLPA